MEAVAKFYASRKKNDAPDHKVAQSILFLVSIALMSLSEEGAHLERGFSTIEKAGLLGQFIRLVPVDPESSADVVTLLQTCLELVKKKLKPGTPTGDILDAVIAGKDGPINEKARSSLVRLQSSARLSNNKDTWCVKSCRHCQKIETRQVDTSAVLMKCQRCKIAYYCNRECQVADWKSHKKACSDVGSGNASGSAFKISYTAMVAFVETNYFDITKEVYKKTQEYDIPKKELFVEIDFYGDAPALRNEFKVWLSSDFLEESSIEDAPEWFRTDAEKKAVAWHLREKYDRVTSDHLLAVCRAGNGIVSTHILHFMAANEGHQLVSNVSSFGRQLLSDEAVECIGRGDVVRMVECLGYPVTQRYFQKKSGLT
jgi:hypothetical protein